MSHFGKYSISMEHTHNFIEEPSWWWKFRAASSADELDLFLWYDGQTKIEIRDGQEKESHPSWIEIAWRELAATFDETNLPLTDVPIEDGGEPFIEADAAMEDIEASLRSMPVEMITELWEALGRINPRMGPHPKNDMLQENNRNGNQDDAWGNPEDDALIPF